MRPSRTDAVGVLTWGMRRYAAIFVGCVLLGAVVAPLVTVQRAAPVEAEALIIAQRLDMDLEALPRYAEAVFANGEVARAAATYLGDVTGEADIIPERVSLISEQDSLVIQVVGRDPEPDVAAALANVSAEAFVEALNNAGAGVGLFALQSPATAPVGTSSGLPLALALAVGAAAGLILGFAAISVLLVARRPVIGTADAEEATGVPAIGVVAVPRTPAGAFASPEEFTGLVPVCRRLLSLDLSTIVVVGPPSDARTRAQLSVALATVLARVRPVRYVGPPRLQAVVAERAAARDTSNDDEDPWAPGATGPRGLTVVDSTEPLDLVHPPQDAVTVLVASVGARSAAMREAAVEHLGGSDESRLVLVKKGRRSKVAAPVPRTRSGPVPRHPAKHSGPGGATASAELQTVPREEKK